MIHAGRYIGKCKMKITCRECKKSFSIPDEKIPSGRQVKLRCPVCRSVILLAPEGKNEQERLTGRALFDHIVKTSKALPPMPQILSKAREIIYDENKGFKEIGELLETDQAMATRVLRIANSAYFGLSVPVSSVRQASALLGGQTLLELITVVSTSKIMGRALKGYGFSSVNVWRHTLSVANASKSIAELKFPEYVNDAFNAGLIHDSGMIVLDEYMAERKDKSNPPSSDERKLIETEKALFGFNHAEIASAFLAKWNLPEIQTNAVKYHHDPQGSGSDKLAYILHASECIMQCGPDPVKVMETAQEGTFDFIDMDEKDIENIYNTTVEAADNIIESISG